MKVLNMVIPILMHFCSLVSNCSIGKLLVIQQKVTWLMTLNYFRQYIARLTTESISYDILSQISDVIQSDCVSKASALEYHFWNIHVKLSSGSRGLNFGQCLDLHLHFVWWNSEGFCKTVYTHASLHSWRMQLVLKSHEPALFFYHT